MVEHIEQDDFFLVHPHNEPPAEIETGLVKVRPFQLPETKATVAVGILQQFRQGQDDLDNGFLL